MLTWIYLNSVCALYEGILKLTLFRFLHKIFLVHSVSFPLVFHVDLSNTLVPFSHSSVCRLFFPLLENAALHCPVKLQYLQFLFLTEMEFNILHCIGFFFYT